MIVTVEPKHYRKAGQGKKIGVKKKQHRANLKKDFIRITFQLKTKFFKNLSQVFFKRNQRNFKKIKFVL